MPKLTYNIEIIPTHFSILHFYVHKYFDPILIFEYIDYLIDKFLLFSDSNIFYMRCYDCSIDIVFFFS